MASASTSASDPPSLSLSSYDAAADHEKFRLCMFVRVLGDKVGRDYLHHRLSRLWKFLRGDFTVSELGSGFFLFTFTVDSDYEQVLRDGPWWVPNRFLVFFTWSPDFRPSMGIVTRADVWVRIYELPVEHYSRLDKVGALIGKFVKPHPETAKQSKLIYAKLCVQIDLTRPLVTQIKIRDTVFDVVYEGKGMKSGFSPIQEEDDDGWVKVDGPIISKLSGSAKSYEPPTPSSVYEFFVKGMIGATKEEHISAFPTTLTVEAGPTLYSFSGAKCVEMEAWLNTGPAANRHMVTFSQDNLITSACDRNREGAMLETTKLVKMLWWSWRRGVDAKFVMAIKCLVEKHRPEIVMVLQTGIGIDSIDKVATEIGFLRRSELVNGGAGLWVLSREQEVRLGITSSAFDNIAVAAHTCIGPILTSAQAQVSSTPFQEMLLSRR